MRLKLILFFLIPVFIIRLSFADGSREDISAKSPENPVEFLDRYIALMEKSDYTGLAKLMYPPELGQFRSGIEKILEESDSTDIQYGWPIFYNKYGYDLSPLFELDSVAFYAEFLELSAQENNLSELLKNASYEITDTQFDGDTLCTITFKLGLKQPDDEVKYANDFVTLIKFIDGWRMKFKFDVEKYLSGLKR